MQYTKSPPHVETAGVILILLYQQRQQCPEQSLQKGWLYWVYVYQIILKHEHNIISIKYSYFHPSKSTHHLFCGCWFMISTFIYMSNLQATSSSLLCRKGIHLWNHSGLHNRINFWLCCIGINYVHAGHWEVMPFCLHIIIKEQPTTKQEYKIKK